MMRAAAYAEFGHFGLAVDDYTEAIGIDSQDPAAFLGRADAYRRLGQFPEGDPRAVQCRPGLACQKALEDYSRALTFDPGNAQAYFARGTVNFKMLRFQGAVSDFTDAIEIDPGYVQAYFERGNALPETWAGT